MKKKTIIFLSVGLLLALVVAACAIDMYQMSNNKPVIFSTWGRKYAPPLEGLGGSGDYAFYTKVPQVYSGTTDENSIEIELEYITELQDKASTAMSNGELPFVSSSAIYEKLYRLHIVVTSNAESDLLEQP